MATTETELCNIALLRVGQRDVLSAYSTDNTPAGRACRVLYPVSRDSVLAVYPWQFARSSTTLTPDAEISFLGWGYSYALPRDFLVSRGIYPGVNDPDLDDLVPYGLSGAISVAKTAAIGGLVRVGTTVTATTATAHNLVAGDTFVLFPGEANFAAGTKTVVTAPTTTTVTYTEAGTATSSTLAQTLTFEANRILGSDVDEADLVYTRAITDLAEMPVLFQDAVAWRLAAELALALPVKPQLAPMMDAAYRTALARAIASDALQLARGTQPDSEFIRTR